MNTDYYYSPFGVIEIRATEKALTNLSFIKEYQSAKTSDNMIIKKTIEQLTEYFEGKRKTFDIPLTPQGTEFQKKVWNALLEIPYGEVVSYASLAKTIDQPKACRAVGSANGKNPIAIIIPCHRVIASDKSLGGYAYGLTIKKDLLLLEKAIK
ncbi:methylated-DNA--[protein]-cysteine S-methyltransferase [Bacteroidales bacterium OttesenSCG-928-M06]|nr:methylated-DNA--[protein]-cysteine S-methyltransferase [Bacteroidales bacterium OttesenSCG-928-M06]